MRNTWIRRISAIRKDGVESAIDLTCGLNCIIGASNTGKTRIAKTVEFACGGKELPFTDKTAYEIAQVTFVTNGGEVSLSRSTHVQNTIHVKSSNPMIVPGSYSVSSRAGKSINTVLLALLGVESTRRIATNETYHTVAFTWNAIRHLMIVPEDQIGRARPSILFPKSTSLATLTQSLSSLLVLVQDEKIEAFRCLVWVSLSGGDGAEVEFAAGQVDHGAEVAHVLESAGSGLDVLDDAVESFEDRVGVGVVEVGEDVPPVAAYLAGELFHGFESGARHPRAQTLEGRLGLGSIGAGVVDVLEGLAHLTGASGFQSSPLQAALGFQLQAGQVRFVPQPQVLGPLEQRVAAGLLFADLVDGLVGVFDHVELVDDSRRVGQPLADALGEPQAHVAGNQTHPVGIAVVIHEIPREPFDRGRVLARDHADYVALHQVGDHGDVPVALPAGLVDAYGLHARVVLVKPRLVHVMADEPPQAGVMFADLLGDVRDRLAFGQLHDHRLEQEREPASRPRPRHRDRVHAVGGARHARHARVNERLVLEEVQMPPHALPRVMHRTRGLAAPRFRAGEPRTRREPDRDMQFPSAVLLVTELHARHPPRVRQLQGGGEQRRGIHTPKLPDQHHHPPTHSPTPNSERPKSTTPYRQRVPANVTPAEKPWNSSSISSWMI